MRRALRSWRGESGAAAVEFILIAPILVILLAAISNLSLRLLELARLEQVTRETAEAALFTSSQTALQTVLTRSIAALGAPYSGSAYSGTVSQPLCSCTGQADIPNCTPAQALTCPSTGQPWGVKILITAQMDFQPLIPGFGTAERLTSTAQVQVR